MSGLQNLKGLNRLHALRSLVINFEQPAVLLDLQIIMISPIQQQLYAA